MARGFAMKPHAGRRLIHWITRALVFVLGRRVVARGARAFFLEARLDLANAIDSNGETLVQRTVLQYSITGNTQLLFDVGANKGEWTLALARAAQQLPGCSISVHAFEPSRDTFFTL